MLDVDITPKSGSPEGFSATILVVEDEDLIRLTVAEFLRDCGYCVFEAANADEAILTLTTENRRIDLVFSDIRMPGTMNGLRLARWVRAHKPTTQIIVTTAYAGPAAGAADPCHPEEVMSKPYSYEKLLQRIRAIQTRMEKA